jgi:hypothetical protein
MSTFERPPQPLPVRVFNGVGRLLRRCGWRRPLSAEGIVHAARRRTGFDDFGDLDVREPLGLLVESLEQENRLTPLGRCLIRRSLARLVEARLAVVSKVKEHPEVLQQEVSRPIFVLGLPRTGTTLLHRLLAQDPAARTLYLWETIWPAQEAAPHRDPRIRRTRRALALTFRLMPRLQSIRPLSADAPEECRLLLMNTFRTPGFGQYGTITGFLRWLDGLGDENTLQVYREYRRQLQLLQWQRPPRRWVLKCPMHAWGLEALLRLFPDACIVQTHRELAEVIPSACSMRATHHGLYVEDFDPGRIAAEATEYLARRILPAALRARSAHPGRVFDVSYRQLVRDPLGVVAGIYQRFGLALSAQAEEGMRTWLADNPQNKHGPHRHSLEQFGLDRAAIDRLVPGYPACIGLPAVEQDALAGGVT